MKAKSTDETYKKICPTCGKRVPGGRPGGSVTALLFAASDCQCQPDQAFADGKMSDRFWQMRRTGAGTMFIAGDSTQEANDADFIGLAPGAIIGGVYEVISLIGRGGMGEVYLARHITLQRKCALKVVPPAQVNEIAWKRFQQEAKTVAKLDHVNLVKVTDLGIHEGCLPFYAMDYVEGKNLGEILSESGPMPLDTVLRIFMQVCDGVECAHRSGILHRDLKPANIMVVSSVKEAHQVKVLDFGLAKLTSADRAKQSLTAVGDLFGSPLYMSPEQCGGKSLDNRSDIYSIGCTMFECLTGQPPFIGNLAAAIMFSQMESSPPSINSLLGPDKCPAAMEAVMAKLLRKNPQERYQTLSELRVDLERVANGKAVSPHSATRSLETARITASESQKLKPPEMKASAFIALAAVILIITVGGLLGAHNLSGLFKNLTAHQSTEKPLVAAPSTKPYREDIANAKELFDHCGIISNGVTKQGRFAVKTFHFPQVSLGQISSESKLSPWSAVGTITLPANGPIGLIFSDSDLEYVWRFPEILRKIGPADITSLSFHCYSFAAARSVNYGIFPAVILKEVRSWTALNDLQFVECDFSPPVINALNALSAKITTLRLVGPEVEGKQLIKVRFLKDLLYLEAREIHDIDSVLTAMKGSRNLRDLNIDLTIPSASALANLKTCPNLRVLTLPNTITDDSFPVICQLSGLRVLNLRGHNRLSKHMLLNVTQLKHLFSLAFEGDKETADQIHAKLPNCRILLSPPIINRPDM